MPRRASWMWRGTLASSALHPTGCVGSRRGAATFIDRNSFQDFFEGPEWTDQLGQPKFTCLPHRRTVAISFSFIQSPKNFYRFACTWFLDIQQYAQARGVIAHLLLMVGINACVQDLADGMSPWRRAPPFLVKMPWCPSRFPAHLANNVRSIHHRFLGPSPSGESLYQS